MQVMVDVIQVRYTKAAEKKMIHYVWHRLLERF